MYCIVGLTEPNIWHETGGLVGWCLVVVNINNKLLLDNQSSLFPQPANCILSEEEGGADPVRAGWINSDL